MQSANVNLANETAVVRIAVRLDEEDLMEARSVGTKDAADSSDASSSATPTVKAVNGDISVQNYRSIKNKLNQFFLSPHYSCSVPLFCAKEEEEEEEEEEELFDCYAVTLMRRYYSRRVVRDTTAL